jgi:hypothetical protein
LHAGRKPRQEIEGNTVTDIVHVFLHTKTALVESGALLARACSSRNALLRAELQTAAGCGRSRSPMVVSVHGVREGGRMSALRLKPSNQINSEGEKGEVE